MKIPTQYLIYLGAAVVIGIVFSFGAISMMSQPAPMQVPLTTYQQPTPVYTAAPPPPPAIPTLTPQTIEGSTAEQAMKANRSSDPYAPALAPVIVTTAPLPTITPVATPSAEVTIDECDPAINPDGAKGMVCVQKNMLANIQGAMNILGICMIMAGVGGIMFFMIRMVDPMGGGGASTSLIIGGMTAIITGAVFLMIGMVILRAMSAAMIAPH
jgi:hypothetical protein